MKVVVDCTIRDEYGHILCETKNKVFQTKTESTLEPTYTIEKLDLRVKMCIPQQRIYYETE